MKKLLLLLATLALCMPFTFAQAPSAYPYAYPVPNDTSTGTTQFRLAKINSSGNAVVMLNTDINGYAGVCVVNCGTTGTAWLVFAGLVPITVDGTATAQHYLLISSTTGGEVHDTGATTYPTTGVVIGRVQTGATSGNQAMVLMYPPEAAGSFVGGTSKQIQLVGGTAIDFPSISYIPAANCVNAVAGAGWSTGATPASLCRAGTNNKDGLLSPWGASDVGYFRIHLPKDWDSTGSIDVSIDLTSTDATNGHTVIMQAASSCVKGDGTTTDDVAFNTAQSFSTITLNGNANRTWTATLTGLTNTGCAAQGILWLKISRTTDTATNVGVYGATVDVPRLLTVQAQ